MPTSRARSACLGEASEITRARRCDTLTAQAEVSRSRFGVRLDQSIRPQRLGHVRRRAAGATGWNDLADVFRARLCPAFPTSQAAHLARRSCRHQPMIEVLP